MLGEGVAQDNAEAIKWWRKAAEQGHPLAEEILKKLGVAPPTCTLNP